MKGIRRHGLGWQARVFVSGMPPSAQAFPLDTDEREMQEWRRAERIRLLHARGEQAIAGRLPAGTFERDAQRYLESVRALKDYRGRCYDIALWAAVFQGRRTHSIRPHEIRAQRDAWLTVGPKRVYDRKAQRWVLREIPLAASTVNHRLRALENLYTVLFPQGYNPVRDVPEAPEPRPEDRSQPYDVIETILAAMPDRSAGERGKPRGAVSKSKARLRLMAYTGLTNSQIAALTRADIDLELPAVRIEDRRKGKGAAGGWLPLPTDARAALQAFIDADAFGRFSRHSLRKSWLRACQEADQPPIRPYDLRHSFASRLLDVTQDLKATQLLLNHASSSTTQRYAQRAIPAWLAAAAGKVRMRDGGQIAGQIATDEPRNQAKNREGKRRQR